jgi:WD40 repeat protein
LLAVTTSEGSIRVWDLESVSVVREIKADDDVLWSAAFSPDTRHLAAASSDEVVTLWNLATGKQQAAFTGHTGGATDLSYLADGVTLVVVDRSGMLHWWDTQTGRRLSDAWPAHPGTSWRLAVHPDGERFAMAGDDGKVKIWDELSIDRACKIENLHSTPYAAVNISAKENARLPAIEPPWQRFIQLSRTSPSPPSVLLTIDP